MNKHSHYLIYGIIAFLLILILGEYWFLLSTHSDSKLDRIGWRLFSKMGMCVRMLFVLLYAFSFSFEPQKLANTSHLNNSQNAINQWVSIVSVVTYLIFGLLLVNAHKWFLIGFPLSLIMLFPSGYFVGKLLKPCLRWLPVICEHRANLHCECHTPPQKIASQRGRGLVLGFCMPATANLSKCCGRRV